MVSEPTAGFPPLIGTNARVLVLGTLPSLKSLELNQYYGHPQNAFWRIMGVLFGAGRDLPYIDRVRALTDHGIAVWDVLASSVRPGSMDAAIERATSVPNNFARLYNEQPGISRVCFNGKSAADLYRRLVAPTLENTSNTRQYQTLPSTSPAYASMSFEEKLDRWRTAIVAAQEKQRRLVFAKPSALKTMTSCFSF